MLGLAARFVSGYLYEAPPADGSPRYPRRCMRGPKFICPVPAGAASIPTHAVFCDDAFVPVAHAALAET